MIASGVVIAFLVGLALEFAFVLVLDRRAAASEREFWEELRAEALDGYGRVFDWAKDTDL